MTLIVQQRGIFQAVKNLIKPSSKQYKKIRRKKRKEIVAVEEDVEESKDLIAPDTITGADPLSITLLNSKEAESSVLSVIRKHQESASDADLKKISLADPRLKMNVVVDIIRQTGRKFADIDVNNIRTAADVAFLLQRPPIDVVAKRKTTVQQHLSHVQLPPNMQWIPSKRDLIDVAEKNNKAIY